MSISLFCPHCHQHAAFNVATTPHGYQAEIIQRGVPWWIGICGNRDCGGTVLVGYEGLEVHPTPRPNPTNAHIPKNIAEALDEAKLCFSTGCFFASAIMARRCVEIACQTKGATGSNLVKKIEDLRQKGVITADLADWAHTIRLVGNDAAHDLNATVDNEDAADLLELANQLLHVVFVTPAVAAKRRTIRGIN